MTSEKPTISIIVAALKPSYGIGNKGKLPWRLRKEMAYFKRVTLRTTHTQNAVIMGRKTWESIPVKFRPLPDRLNIVLSRSFTNEEQENGVIHANSIGRCVELIKEKNLLKVFIIGGSEIYHAFLREKGLVDYLLITEIEQDVKNAEGKDKEGETKDEVEEVKEVEMDTFLKFDTNEWVMGSQEELKEYTGETEIETNVKEGDFTYNYTIWKRK